MLVLRIVLGELEGSAEFLKADGAYRCTTREFGIAEAGHVFVVLSNVREASRIILL